MSTRVLRLNEVKTLTGLSRSTLYARIAADAFPRPVSLGERAVGWRQTEIDEWIAALSSKQVSR
jgi:prophage regulatory protein